MNRDFMDLIISQVIIQPTSLCNLNCVYCYVPNRRDAALMNNQTLEAVIFKLLSSSLIREKVDIIWHAGEPLAAGLAFYINAMNIINVHNTRNIRIRNVIQTNGTLITDEWCNFFNEFGFSIGLSIDGPAFIHDRQRVNWSKKGSHEQVMRGYKILKQHGIVPGAICVLTRESLAYPEEIFHFFLENDFRSLAFNVEEAENDHVRSSLQFNGEASRAETIEAYRRFMSRVFDLWRPYAKSMEIREFRDLIHTIQGKLRDPAFVPAPLETRPLGIITIQRNGDISTYSPEFAGARSDDFNGFVIGNINTISSLEELQNSSVYLQLLKEVELSREACASSCVLFGLCGGGFLANKFFENKTLRSTETVSCVLHLQTMARVLIEKLSK